MHHTYFVCAAAVVLSQQIKQPPVLGLWVNDLDNLRHVLARFQIIRANRDLRVKHANISTFAAGR